MKAILELEMPESCICCPFVDIPQGNHTLPGIKSIPLKDTYISCKITGETAYRIAAMKGDTDYCDYRKERAAFCPLKILDIRSVEIMTQEQFNEIRTRYKEANSKADVDNFYFNDVPKLFKYIEQLQSECEKLVAMTVEIAKSINYLGNKIATLKAENTVLQARVDK